MFKKITEVQQEKILEINNEFQELANIKEDEKPQDIPTEYNTSRRRRNW